VARQEKGKNKEKGRVQPTMPKATGKTEIHTTSNKIKIYIYKK